MSLPFPLHWTDALLNHRAQRRYQNTLNDVADEEYEAAVHGNDKRAKYLHYLQEESLRLVSEAHARVTA